MWVWLLQIVVASPSDVQDERDALVAAVQELNRIYGKERSNCLDCQGGLCIFF
jgi:hypothetical protein